MSVPAPFYCQRRYNTAAKLAGCLWWHPADCPEKLSRHQVRPCTAANGRNSARASQLYSYRTSPPRSQSLSFPSSEHGTLSSNMSLLHMGTDWAGSRLVCTRLLSSIFRSICRTFQSVFSIRPMARDRSCSSAGAGLRQHSNYHTQRHGKTGQHQRRGVTTKSRQMGIPNPKQINFIPELF